MNEYELDDPLFEDDEDDENDSEDSSFDTKGSVEDLRTFSVISNWKELVEVMFCCMKSRYVSSPISGSLPLRLRMSISIPKAM